MRASQYIVTSDKVFRDESGNLLRVVLHTASSQIYLLSIGTWEQLISHPADLQPEERDELVTAGLLVDDDKDEFSEVIAENADNIKANRTRKFVLMPAAYCNMGCGYCGQEHIRLPRVEQHRDTISRRLLLATRSPLTSGISINWFGAEPMMGYAQILDISGKIIPACDQRGLHYSAFMVTNGSLLSLEKIRRLCLECRIDHFEITIDGPSERHNVQRPLKSGLRSFDRIVQTVREACEAGIPNLSFSIRTNVSRSNQGDHREFAAAMANAGLARPDVSYYIAMVREWGNDVSAYAVAKEDIIDIEQAWLDAYEDFGLRANNLPIGRKHQVCVAVNTRAEVISPTGEIHTCTEQPLVPSRAGSSVGHVTQLQTPALRPPGQFDDWNGDLIRSTKAYCPTCAIFPICGGQCPLVWSEGKPACPTTKATMPMLLSRYGAALGLVAA